MLQESFQMWLYMPCYEVNCWIHLEKSVTVILDRKLPQHVIFNKKRLRETVSYELEEIEDDKWQPWFIVPVSHIVCPPESIDKLLLMTQHLIQGPHLIYWYLSRLLDYAMLIFLFISIG